MLHALENDHIKIVVNQQGAELQSIYHKTKNTELLWQGDDNFWPRRAPILFPIVGKLIDNTYHYQQKNYTLGQHGFARDSFFELSKQTTNELTFRLVANEITLINYPFYFVFEVAYILKGKVLTQQFNVKNNGQTDMYCSYGGHPAFNAAPITEYTLTFEPALKHDLFQLQNGSIAPIPITKVETAQIALREDTFDKDALILAQSENLHITLNKKNDKILTVYTNGMPYLGLWSKPKAPFVCIEPWHGWADVANHKGSLKDKSGILKIAPLGEHNGSFEIVVH